MNDTQPPLVILNAGSGWNNDAEAADVIRKSFHDHGRDCRIEWVRPGMDIEKFARDEIRSGVRHVIAGGGDGTLRAVAAAVSGSEATMGVLPVGTLNHFARDMEIPLELNEAAEVAADGVPVCVDVAEANSRVFINNSVIGIYPFYRSQRDQIEKPGIPKFLVVLRAWYRAIVRYPHMNIRLQIDGQEHRRRTTYVLVANNEHAFEGFKPWERGRMTDGRLSVYVLRDRSRLAIVRLLFKMLFGQRLAHDEFEVFQAEEVAIETRRRTLSVSLDGEIFRLASPLRYRIRHGELKVTVPAGSKRIAESLCPVEVS